MAVQNKLNLTNRVQLEFKVMLSGKGIDTELVDFEWIKEVGQVGIEP